MYQSEWFDEVSFEAEEKKNPSPDFKSKVDKEKIEKVLFCHWEEHCQECAPPLCYSTCSVYLRREDLKCKKVYYGIKRNKKFSGLYSFGADMRFRKWGKLSANLYNTGLSQKQLHIIENVNLALVKQANTLSSISSIIDKTRKPNGAFNYYRNKMLYKLKPDLGYKFDDFLIECYSFEKQAFRLIIENNKFTENFYRNSVLIEPGHNLHRIRVKDFKYKDDIISGGLVIFPENDIEARLVFTWLDFVKYKKQEENKKADLKPADKIKCVAWDLDNTLWKGVFIESKPENLVINADALKMIKKLDEMGVLQTIVSKNTHDDVWPFIESLGLGEYFLYPAINWGQKSENLKKIADLLNINVDTFALIDDSIFERQEVSTALPQVRVYTDGEINSITGYPEFDLPITEESKNRRSYYLVEQKRGQIAESFAGDYHSFLRNCGIKLNIFTPAEEGQITRCYELIQRTNQLNLSSRRYDAAAFDEGNEE